MKKKNEERDKEARMAGGYEGEFLRCPCSSRSLERFSFDRLSFLSSFLSSRFSSRLSSSLLSVLSVLVFFDSRRRSARGSHVS